jgi:hypothetical protein
MIMKYVGVWFMQIHKACIWVDVPVLRGRLMCATCKSANLLIVTA